MWPEYKYCYGYEGSHKPSNPKTRVYYIYSHLVFLCLFHLWISLHIPSLVYVAVYLWPSLPLTSLVYMPVHLRIFFATPSRLPLLFLFLSSASRKPHKPLATFLPRSIISFEPSVTHRDGSITCIISVMANASFGARPWSSGINVCGGGMCN